MLASTLVHKHEGAAAMTDHNPFTCVDLTCAACHGLEPAQACEHPIEQQTIVIKCACGAEKPALDVEDRPITVAQLLLWTN
jgi:hypothetical protein